METKNYLSVSKNAAMVFKIKIIPEMEPEDENKGSKDV